MLLNHHQDSPVKQSEVWIKEKDMSQMKINLNRNSESLVSLRILQKAEFILRRLHLQLMLVIVTLMMTQFNTLRILLQDQVPMKFTQQTLLQQRNFTPIVKSHLSESQQKDL